ncbi:MAG TPA: rhodanese-like domain-containing protein [Bacillales bacterium]|nr:rhodanese-like domain-containing protein [Bacillales bacterium]
MQYVLIAIIVAFLVYFAVSRLSQRRYLKTLTEEEFRNGYRKAQLIDVREPNEFKNGHILGARNIPMSQLKMRLTEIRKDKPVYLYDQNGVRSARTAAVLKKKGYQDLNQLKGGFKKWNGKIKKS